MEKSRKKNMAGSVQFRVHRDFPVISEQSVLLPPVVALLSICETRADPLLTREICDVPRGVKTTLEVSHRCRQLTRTM